MLAIAAAAVFVCVTVLVRSGAGARKHLITCNSLQIEFRDSLRFVREDDIRDYLQDFPGKPVLVIDDLEQMHRERGPGRLYDGVLRKLKALAVEYDIPIVVLADLSRACQRCKDHRPRISDIRHVRDTSAIDLIMMLHSEGYYAESYGSRRDDLELIVEDRRKTI